jgi:hypothetical protein
MQLSSSCLVFMFEEAKARLVRLLHGLHVWLRHRSGRSPSKRGRVVERLFIGMCGARAILTAKARAPKPGSAQRAL